MRVENDVIAAGRVMRPDMVRVWDPFVRIFHWSLVALFAVAFLTGDEWMKAHVVAGYAIAGLVAARILWGFIGSRHCTVCKLHRRTGCHVGVPERDGAFQGKTLSRAQSGRRRDGRRHARCPLRHCMDRLHDDDRCVLGCRMGRGPACQRGVPDALLDRSSCRWCCSRQRRAWREPSAVDVHRS